MPKIAIVYLSYHSDPHLPDVVSALQRLTYPRDSLLVIIVDNLHPKHGSSVRAIEETVLPHAGVDIPEVVVLSQKENLGFAGGNNVGARYALERGCGYIFFHNDDGFLAPDALEPLISAMERDASIAIAQSLILLHPETNRVNSAGNSFHYLGFGYCNEYRTPLSEFQDKLSSLFPPLEGVNTEVVPISYASGAAVMMRADVLRSHGLWDADLFMYHEDIEMSLRLRSRGYRIVLVSSSIFYHKYQFNRSIQKLYWMERNRFAIILLYYRAATLLLLLPMLVLLECGLFFMALLRGWWKDRLRVYAYWIRPQHWRMWIRKRRDIQKKRTVGDRVLLQFSVPAIIFQEAAVMHPLLTFVGNPVMRVYWKIMRFLVR